MVLNRVLMQQRYRSAKIYNIVVTRNFDAHFKTSNDTIGRRIFLNPICNLPTRFITVIVRKYRTISFYPAVMRPKELDGMSDSINPDHTTQTGAV